MQGWHHEIYDLHEHHFYPSSSLARATIYMSIPLSRASIVTAHVDIAGRDHDRTTELLQRWSCLVCAFIHICLVVALV